VGAVVIVNAYLSLDALKSALGDTTTDYDVDYERAIEAASRQIDDWCDGKHFWREPVAVKRVFRPVNRYLVRTSFFADADSVLVETDDDEDGTFDTVWTADQWQPEPLARTNNYPYEQIVAITRTRRFPLNGRRATVRVTAPVGLGGDPGPGCAGVPDSGGRQLQVEGLHRHGDRDRRTRTGRRADRARQVADRAVHAGRGEEEAGDEGLRCRSWMTSPPAWPTRRPPRSAFAATRPCRSP